MPSSQPGPRAVTHHRTGPTQQPIPEASAQTADSHSPGRKPVIAALITAAPLIALLNLGVLAMLLGGDPATSTRCGRSRPSIATQVADIPANYLRPYQNAASTYGVAWSVLAGIGKTESDHGRSTRVGVHAGANYAGAQGPMQFLPGTWEAYGVDGDHDRHINIYDPDDAIPAAARLLKANGAPQQMRQAIFAYNHATWYVDKVLALARTYAYAARPKPVPAAHCTSRTNIVRNDQLAKVLAYARRQLGKPYVWGAEGPDAFDCSGLTMRAYRAAGITIPRVTYDQWRRGKKIPPGREQPGDLVFFNRQAQGPGHVGIVIGRGKMINARCTACRPGIAIDPYRRRDLVGFVRLLASTSAPEAGTFTASYFWDDGSGHNGDTGQPASGKPMQCGLFASPMWPLGTRVKVTNIRSGRSATGFIGDFGPGQPAERQHRPVLLDLDACTFAKLTGSTWSRQRPWYVNSGLGHIRIKYQVLSWGHGPTFKGRAKSWRP